VRNLAVLPILGFYQILAGSSRKDAVSEILKTYHF
jgi:hypothetical protein